VSSGTSSARSPLPTLPTLKRSGSELAAPARQIALLDGLELEDPLDGDFERHLDRAGLVPLRATGIGVFQINVGKLCNQACRHCHVDAGPDRTEVMSRETAEQCVDVLRRFAIPVVYITGGAPELNPSFRWLVEQSTSLGRHVIDRCNLTILETGPHRELPEFFADHRVELICSLPHYESACTDTQRGQGVFEKSIRALRRLNALGYGDGQSGLRLVLVTNPVGAGLPGAQACLEIEWKRELKARHDVSFDALYTITNMPISRHLEWLQQTDNLEGYMRTLVQTFNPQAAHGVMCRSMVSVGWDGHLYDCDFNQMLEIPMANRERTLWDEGDLSALEGNPIATDNHCYGCTAGYGSSCGGALSIDGAS